jgi:choline dehydrogenase-like flavoprotein
MGLHPFPLPRAILSEPWRGRDACRYTGYCGSYGCTTMAKGSSRVALLSRAVATGRCEVRPHATARRVLSDARGLATGAEYRDRDGRLHVVTAEVVVVACQAIETARLLLLSTGPKHPKGLGNGSGWVGRNLIFSPDGAGWGDFPHAAFSGEKAKGLRSTETFVNRAIQDWYAIDDPSLGRRRKGGTVDFLLKHPNAIGAAISLATWDQVGEEGPLWGAPLKDRLRRYFRDEVHLRFEIFADWIPVPNCRVTLDPTVRDAWGVPVARVRVESHPWNTENSRWLCARGEEVLRAMGARNVRSYVSGGPSTNLVAGTCRFGRDPRTSVLDPDCRAHEVENLFVTDGSFMPTGGSVPYTWTIYANSFRVAEKIVAHLGGTRGG